VKRLVVFSLVIVAALAWIAYPQSTRVTPDDGAPDAGTISVASLNMARESDAQKVLRDIHAAPRLRRADVFLLQEVAGTDDKDSVATDVARRLGYFASFSPAPPEVRNQGLAVISRYPISGLSIQNLKNYNLRFHTRKRFAMSINVQTPAGGVRVWNAHLDTRVSAQQRLDQLAPVLEEARSAAGPRLIGGDFNTNDFAWVGHVLPIPQGRSYNVSAVRRAMENAGFETPFDAGLITFPSTRQHLDWIFVNGLQAVSSGVEPVPFSDHRAIWTRFRVMP
jgi:endonuclease/exonuclease/phosphatase family metal-dependent hydrolase